MKLFCKHKWTVLRQHATKSQLEQMVDNGFKPSTINAFALEKKVIFIVCCNECGKLKKIVETDTY